MTYSVVDSRNNKQVGSVFLTDQEAEDFLATIVRRKSFGPRAVRRPTADVQETIDFLTVVEND